MYKTKHEDPRHGQLIINLFPSYINKEKFFPDNENAGFVGISFIHGFINFKQENKDFYNLMKNLLKKGFDYS